ncbi:MAG: glycosyltransferase family 4 protein [Bacteroides sp.]|nr:glycosyltransferase family 4 protein [Bacteroides sp.]
MNSGDYDIFHPTFLDTYFLPYKMKNRPLVVTIHDLITAKYPQYFKCTQLEAQKKLTDAATHIIAVSENTKKDIIEILNVPSSRVSVIYHGTPELDKSYLLGLGRPIGFEYFLYVGNRLRYKNFQYLLEQSSKILLDSGIKLVCTGYPFTPNEIDMIKRVGLEGSVVHRFASTNELFSLYKYAKAFIYPSSYEGFGMPILESFICGCPVILNKASCFPEIAGDAALYFDVNENNESLSCVLERFINLSVSQLSLLVNRGYERARKFTWEKSASELANIYQSIL